MTETNGLPDSMQPRTNQSTSRRARRRATLIFLTLFAASLLTLCTCVLSYAIGSQEVSPIFTPTAALPKAPCDLAEAVAFDQRFFDSEIVIVDDIYAILHEEMPPFEIAISAHLKTAYEWQHRLGNAVELPDCYNSILARSLALNRQAMDNHIAALEFIRASDYVAAGVAFESAIEASNMAGTEFNDVVCAYDVSSVVSMIKRCAIWLTQ